MPVGSCTDGRSTPTGSCTDGRLIPASSCTDGCPSVDGQRSLQQYLRHHVRVEDVGEGLALHCVLLKVPEK